MARVLLSAVLSAAAFAGVSLASRSASAQGYYRYEYRPAPPRAYYYGQPAPYGQPYGQPVRYYDEREAPYAVELGFDLEGAVPVGINVPGTANDLRGGIGFKGRLGYQLRYPGIRFTPEFGYGFDHLWAQDDNNNQFGWDMNRFFGGARLSFGRFVVPTVYAHLGYGWRQLSQTASQVITGANGGLAYDVGGALDLRLVPHFGIGAHLEYAAIDIPVQPQWIAVGAHADIIF
jgi:hypothetical protein